MDIPTPQVTAEHELLTAMVGEWTFESEAVMAPDQPPMKGTGTESVRKIGDLWVVGEWTHEMPGCGENMTSIITLGFDTTQNRFVGSFIASCMAQMWHYNGSYNNATRTLTLDTKGPSFTDPSVLSDYQDIVCFVDNNTRKLTSQVKMPDGSWMQFMTMTSKRTR